MCHTIHKKLEPVLKEESTIAVMYYLSHADRDGRCRLSDRLRLRLRVVGLFDSSLQDAISIQGQFANNTGPQESFLLRR